jgi:cytochrome c
MKNLIKGLTLLLVFSFTILSCGGGEEKKGKKKITIGSKEKKETKKVTKKEKKSETFDLSNKGIGPVKSITLTDAVDETMAATGKKVYDAKCTACHKIGKKFIGPAPNGIFERRSPEWIMNMILNPDEMVKKDPIARALLIEYNGSPMANQSLSEEEARSILEYFRTL